MVPENVSLYNACIKNISEPGAIFVQSFILQVTNLKLQKRRALHFIPHRAERRRRHFVWQWQTVDAEHSNSTCRKQVAATSQLS